MHEVQNLITLPVETTSCTTFSHSQVPSTDLAIGDPGAIIHTDMDPHTTIVLQLVPATRTPVSFQDGINLSNPALACTERVLETQYQSGSNPDGTVHTLCKKSTENVPRPNRWASVFRHRRIFVMINPDRLVLYKKLQQWSHQNRFGQPRNMPDCSYSSSRGAPMPRASSLQSQVVLRSNKISKSPAEPSLPRTTTCRFIPPVVGPFVMECLPWDLFLGHVYDSVDSRATVGWSLMPYIF